MFFRFPRAHVHANFSDQSQGGRFMDAVHLGQIHSADSMGCPAHRIRLIRRFRFSGARFEAVRVHFDSRLRSVFRRFVRGTAQSAFGSRQTIPNTAST